MSLHKIMQLDCDNPNCDTVEMGEGEDFAPHGWFSLGWDKKDLQSNPKEPESPESYLDMMVEMGDPVYAYVCSRACAVELLISLEIKGEK
jgi:hypothetical protein